jgi:hypothetical protein
MKRSTKVGAGAIVALTAVTPVAIAGPAGAEPAGGAISRSMSCSGSKFVFNSGIPGNITFDFRATISGSLNSNGSAATFNRINYSFSNVKWTGETGWPVKAGAAGIHSNVNVKAPIGWNSPDSLGGSGTVFPAPFSVGNGGTVRIEGIPDIADLPDPACTASATIGWTVTK